MTREKPMPTLNDRVIAAIHEANAARDAVLAEIDPALLTEAHRRRAVLAGEAAYKKAIEASA